MNNLWVTFVDNEEHLKSAYLLALSLQKVQSLYPLCIMFPNNFVFDINIFYKENLNIIIKEVPWLLFDMTNTSNFNSTINKFQCLLFEEYDVIGFIDADIILYKNIDDWFKKKLPLFILHDDHTLSGGMFIIKPDINLYCLILNLCIAKNFSTDEEILMELIQWNFIPYSFLFKVEGKYFFHDGGLPKITRNIDWQDLKSFYFNNLNQFHLIQKMTSNTFSNEILQANYQENIKNLLHKKYN